MNQQKNQEVVHANIELHKRVAATYNESEPHFRSENIEKVSRRIERILAGQHPKRMLDLGCGTGFLINICKPFFQVIHGVDVTQAMLDRVDKSGPAEVILFNEDTGKFPAEEGAYDLVTCYSFLHHLFEIGPTLRTAFRGLKPGGKFYADLEPNVDFWDHLSKLDRHGDYDAVVKREIEMVTFKDEDIVKQFGISSTTFNHAEYGKSIRGGFSESDLQKELKAVGFREVQVFYHWFIGEGALINSAETGKEEGLHRAAIVHEVLQRALPLSRGLFKYLGFIAVK